MKDLRLTLFVFLFAFSLSSCSTQKNTTSNIKSLVSSQRFIFKAQTAIPLGIPIVQLTSPYDLRVSGDSVVAYLPYFGRAYNIDPYSSEGGIKFTSTKFNYKVNPKKNGGYDITILPQDQQDVRQVYLTVMSSGTATLQVLTNNRQPISYDGYVSAK